MKKMQTLKTQTTELESSEKYAENTDNNSSSELLKQKQFGDTPFTVVEFEGKKLLTVGKYKLGEFNDEAEMHDYLERNMWRCIGILVQTVVEANNLK